MQTLLSRCFGSKILERFKLLCRATTAAELATSDFPKSKYASLSKSPRLLAPCSWS